MPNGLFKKPVTPKKVALYMLIALGVFAVAFIGKTAYVALLNPKAAFTTPIPKAEARAVTPAPQKTPKPVDNLALNEAPVATLEPEPDPGAVLLSQADLEFLKDRVTILLIGADQSPERLDFREEYRSDVLMLLTIDFSSKKVDMLSIPRDSYARIYNKKGRWKINACFAHGGGADKESFLYARETISMLLGGVPVPYHVGVTMDGIKRVVDAMGGVDYDVDVEIHLNGRTLAKGPQHLNGQQVLDYCRARKGISTDLGRIDRQQRMLFTIFDQLKSRNQLVNIPGIINSVKDDIYTNLNFEQIAALTVFASGIDLSNIDRHTLKGEYMNVYNASFFVLNQDYKCKLVKDIFGVAIKPDKDYDVSKVRHDVKSDSSQKALSDARAFLDSNAGNLTIEQQNDIFSHMNALQNAVENDGSGSVDSAISSLNGKIGGSNNPAPAPAPVPMQQPDSVSGAAAPERQDFGVVMPLAPETGLQPLF